jgi:ribosome-associated translation inhibitor RaiA
MTPNIQFRGFAGSAGLRTWLLAGLRELQQLTAITAVDVRLERQAGTSPAVHASVHLAIAGPDLHVTAADHTIQTVWRRILNDLKTQITRRKAKQRGRHKGTQLVHGHESRRLGSVLQKGC